jgi:hypothetical protein
MTFFGLMILILVFLLIGESLLLHDLVVVEDL